MISFYFDNFSGPQAGGLHHLKASALYNAALSRCRGHTERSEDQEPVLEEKVQEVFQSYLQVELGNDLTTSIPKDDAHSHQKILQGEFSISG